MPDSYDLIVIGSGPAGEKTAAKAAYFGRSVALIEKESVLGGAGVNTGTLPSKTLRESAIYFSGKHDTGVFGADRRFERSTSIADFMYRKTLVTDVSADDVADNLRRHGVEVRHGFARFHDRHSIALRNGSAESETVLSANHFVIATGSYPFHPDGIPFDAERIHDSDTILTIDHIPRSLCVVGAGVIGCEYATIFATMGTKVHLLNTGTDILGFVDREIAGALVDRMRDDGIKLHFGASITGVTADDDGVTVKTDTGETIATDMFLFAAGRSGCSAGLGCEAAGIVTGKRETIIVNERYQTSVPHIYAVGDVIGFPALAATGMDQGRVAISHMYGINDFDSLPKVFPYGIYTVPEVSMVGETEEAVKASGVEYFVGRAHHARVARGRIMGDRHGLLKLVVRKSDSVILGVHIVGRQASELIHYGQTLVADRKQLSEVIATVFNHPTLHELYKYACYDALGNLSGRKLREG